MFATFVTLHDQYQDYYFEVYESERKKPKQTLQKLRPLKCPVNICKEAQFHYSSEICKLQSP